jgi:thiamine biosynthesis lipoprotein
MIRLSLEVAVELLPVGNRVAGEAGGRQGWGVREAGKIFGVLMLLALSGRAAAEERRFSFERPLMGTRFAIICHGAEETVAKAAADEAFAEGEKINAVASDYLPDSELMRLPAGGAAVEVSPLLADLLEVSQRMAERCDGAFDPTLGPLTVLWRESRRTGELPADGDRATALAACGWRELEFDGKARTVRLKKPGMRLDLGGIAKGFAADRMFEVMQRHGFARTCIAAGGDLRLGDPPPGKPGWRVGLKTFDPGKPEEVVELSNCAVSTSGDLHQFVEVGGKRYSHILDPRTGLGLTERLAVSVIAPTATVSDALATACCVTGAAGAEEFGLKRGATRVIVRK